MITIKTEDMALLKALAGINEDDFDDMALEREARAGGIAAARAAINAGADVNARGSEGGSTALMYAARDGLTDTVGLLLDRGAEMEARTRDGKTALMYAARDGQTDTVSLLLDRGANVNARTATGEAALMHAAKGGSLETVALLLNAGANVNAIEDIGDGSEWTAQGYAIQGGHRKIVDLLRATEQARSLASTLDTAHPAEIVPGPSAHVRLSNDPMNRAPREDLGAPDPKPDKPRRVRL